MRFPSFYCFYLALFVVSACGYGMRRQEFGLHAKGDDGRVPRLFVPVVDNRTTRTGFEPTVTNSFRNALNGVSGVTMARDENEADYILLTTVTTYDTSPESLVAGNAATQIAGGLRSNLLSASTIRLNVEVQAKLVEKAPGSGMARRVLWDRVFQQAGVYEASNRYFESASLPPKIGAPRSQGGSSSSPNINDSRENLQLKALADKMAQQLVDQVVEDF